MTNAFKRILLASLVFIGSIALVGCTDANGLALLERAASNSIEVTDNLDAIDESDLSDSDVSALTEVESAGSIMNLAMEIDLTPFEKAQQIRALHQQIVDLHFQIVDERTLVRVSFETLRNSIASIRENQIVLSETDKAQVQAWAEELRQIRTDLQATIGQAFPPMRDLRGEYTIDNLDHILEVHQEVCNVLVLRLEKIQRTNEILALANTLLQSYLEI